MEKTVSKPLTLSGRYFSKKDIIAVQQTVRLFPALSMTELAQTLCEHLNWVTAKGRNKINSCFTALEKLEALGFIQLPEKRDQKQRESKKITWSDRTRQGNLIECALDSLGEIELQRVSEKTDVVLWNEYVDRYHYLGYKHPIGCALKYFIVVKTSEKSIILGCLLFSSAVWHLADRDQWIGWDKKDREQRLNLVINNTRFLIFPWVKVPNLASRSLARVTRQIQDDWQSVHGYRPVLIETFVDDSRYSGACYQASNWQRIGKTSGKDWQVTAENQAGSVKSIFVFPLQTNFRAALENLKPADAAINSDEKFVLLWGKVVHIIADVALAFDEQWQQRKRLIDSLLLVFLIFRLVFSKNSQGYGTTLEDFWANCHRMKFPLPQKQPVSASSFATARKKLDEALFKVLNARIIAACGEEDDAQYRWFNHRLFAVDGSKLNLPRPLTDSGYKTPNDNAHYPQGLLSCLYQLKSRIPYDFDLVNHGNERQCALAHLKTLRINDVVVYDRGYFSYAMLYYHLQAGVYPVFRLQQNTYKIIDAFRNSDLIDQVITLLPSKSAQREIKKQYPTLMFTPLKIRLVKYIIGDETHCIGTTLMNLHIKADDFKAVYHERWGIEELYKISKNMIEVDDFHGRSERTVKQETFAHFVLITMSRLCANESENILTSLFSPMARDKDKSQKIQVNFKNTLATISRHLEAFMFVPAHCIRQVMDDIVTSISRHRQKARPERSYTRKSMKPESKWRGCKAQA